MATTLILLVDNIPDHVSSYEAALSERGHRVCVATTGLDALTIARATRFDCTVIDVRLPDMSGWDLCKQLKCDEGTCEVPVVVLTPDTSRAQALESERVQCNAWIAQPAQAEDLVRLVDHVLVQDESAPRTPDEAMLGVTTCPACGSDRVRATLRVSPIQYYVCRTCSHSWRIEAL